MSLAPPPSPAAMAPAEDAAGQQGGTLEGFFRCIAACNEGAEEQLHLIPFYVGDDVVGYLRPE